MSFSTANTASGGAVIDRLRSTWNVAGLVAAIDSTAMIATVMTRNSVTAIRFSMGYLLGRRKILLRREPRRRARHERPACAHGTQSGTEATPRIASTWPVPL